MEWMIDLETMNDNPKNAAITAIGMVEFDFETGIGREFYQKVNLQSCLDYGMEISVSTVEWWLQQPDEARLEIVKPGVNIGQALVDLVIWADNQSLPLWGNGAPFDNVALRNAYEKVGITPFWGFRQDRCYRTIKSLFPLEMPLTEGVKHNALDDARWQALHLIELNKRYGFIQKNTD